MFVNPYFYLGLGCLAMIIQAIVVYGESSRYYYLPGWLVSSIACFCWLYAAKLFGGNNSELFKFAAVWDIAIATTWLIIPAVFFDVGITNMKIIGILLMMIGVIVINLPQGV